VWVPAWEDASRDVGKQVQRDIGRAGAATTQVAMSGLEESVQLLSSVECLGQAGSGKYDMVSWCMVGLMCACRDKAPQPPSYDLLHV